MGLIPVPSHTQADREMWATLAEADLAYASLPVFQRRAEQARSAISEFVADGPCYLSVSWGKDSVTCAHLLWEVCQDKVLLVHIIQQPGENPYNAIVRDAFLTRFPMPYQEVLADYTGIDGSENEIDRQTDKVFLRCFKKLPYTRYLSGIRRDESGGRAIRMMKHGLRSLNTLAPIGYWKIQDVYAYLAKHDLPIHPNYGMLGGGRWPRESLRVCRVGGVPGRGMGRLLWENEYYSSFLRKHV